MSDRQAGSVIVRVRLGARLRRLREARGITAQQAAAAIRGSDSKISRIELGRQVAREIDVVDLLDFYHVTDQEERDDLLALASQAGVAPWFQRHGDALPAWYQSYLGYEEAASSVLTYDTHFVPGLLQTEDYARGLLARGEVQPADAQAWLAIQAERLARYSAGGWRLAAVIDEAVLRRPVVDAGVLAGQLRHLRDAAGWPGVSIQVRPLAAGAPHSPSGFTILRFGDPDLPDVVYTEQLTGGSFLDRAADVARYKKVAEVLQNSSPPPDQTAALLADLIMQLGDARA